MFFYIWPVALIIISNLVYHICAKSMPDGVNPFAALTVTYLIGAVISTVLFFITGHKESFTKEITKMNWVPYVFGIVIVGLEAGNIYAYKAGWQVSTQAIVQSSILAIGLLLVGHYLYGENMAWNKIIGIAVCILGLMFINMK